MNQPRDLRLLTAPRGAVCASAVAWIDSGITPGLVVVDSNRPASMTTLAIAARGLRRQFGAAH